MFYVFYMDQAKLHCSATPPSVMVLLYIAWPLSEQVNWPNSLTLFGRDVYNRDYVQHKENMLILGTETNCLSLYGSKIFLRFFSFFHLPDLKARSFLFSSQASFPPLFWLTYYAL